MDQKRTGAHAASLDTLLEERNIAFYGCEEQVVPDFALSRSEGRIRFFLGASRRSGEGRVEVRTYEHLSEIRGQRADVYFLDTEAVRSVFAYFPTKAAYLLVCLKKPRVSWLLAALGIVRRALRGEIQLKGIRRFETRGSSVPWLVIKNRWVKRAERFSLSTDLGIQGFLDFLRREKVRYVVERNFEKLPRLYRAGGDLDILVADEDEQKVKDFLRQHPGHVNVGINSVSRPITRGNVLSYPPRIAREILESAVEGPARSRIPAPREAFLGLVYHVLYHLGGTAGVPSSLSAVDVARYPNNDYNTMLSQKAKALGIPLRVTMEDLDTYLSKEGWQPRLDSLALIAEKNEWVRERFFTQAEKIDEIGVGVFVLKEHAFHQGVSDDILSALESEEDFRIVHTKHLKGEEKIYVANHLRGGVWADKAGKENEYWPAMIVVVFDLRMAKFSKANPGYTEANLRIRHMKKTLRRRFDRDPVSLIHSTDTTAQAWEYIDVCFGNSAAQVREEIKTMYDSITLSWSEKVRSRSRLLSQQFSRRLKAGERAMRNYVKKLLTA